MNRSTWVRPLFTDVQCRREPVRDNLRDPRPSIVRCSNDLSPEAATVKADVATSRQPDFPVIILGGTPGCCLPLLLAR